MPESVSARFRLSYENQGFAEWIPPGESEPFTAETYDRSQLAGLFPYLPPSQVDPNTVLPAESVVEVTGGGEPGVAQRRLVPALVNDLFGPAVAGANHLAIFHRILVDDRGRELGNAIGCNLGVDLGLQLAAVLALSQAW